MSTLKKSKKLFRKTRELWRHYLFEFVILFLAITLGFFVENKREALADQEREVKLMVALVEEIKADTVRINEIINLRLDRIRKNDSLIALINASDRNKHMKKIYLYGMNAAARKTLYYETNIMMSLRNGGFYTITHAAAAETIRQYYVACHDLLATQENGDEFGGKTHNDLVRRVFDARIAHQFISGALTTPAQEIRLFTNDPAIINEFCYTVNYINISFNLQVMRLKKMKERAKELLITVPREYELY